MGCACSDPSGQVATSPPLDCGVLQPHPHHGRARHHHHHHHHPQHHHFRIDTGGGGGAHHGHSASGPGAVVVSSSGAIAAHGDRGGGVTATFAASAGALGASTRAGAAGAAGNSQGQRTISECPICYASASDVEPLPHKSSSGDVAAHRACRKCREELVKRNASCPWCRTEMVWQTVFGVLDGLKGATRGYREGQHDELANLMAMWQEYEMIRTKSDISLFAREMSTDPAVVARLEGALLNSSGWLRDSAGLWIRFYALYADGETELSAPDGDRLRRAVDGAIESFERDHGGHPDFVGAMYQQAAVAVLSASFSGMSTKTAAAQARRVGESALKVFRRHYATQPRCASQVRERLTRDYAEAVSEIVWGPEPGADPILRTFFQQAP